MHCLPAQTLDLAFGTAVPKTVQDIFAWQLAGAGIATLVAPVAFTQKVHARAKVSRTLLSDTHCRRQDLSIILTRWSVVPCILSATLCLQHAAQANLDQQ